MLPFRQIPYSLTASNDAVRVAGLSRSSLYNLIGEGKLRSVLVAGRRLIPADALRDLVRGERA
jgi:hypothetical protein